MDKATLRRNYIKACEDYALAFAEKHGYDELIEWSSDYSLAWISDMPISLQTIIDDIEIDAPECEFIKWYDYVIEMGMLGDTNPMNFSSWVNGCPRRSKEQIDKLKKLQEEIEGLKSELEKMLNENY